MVLGRLLPKGTSFLCCGATGVAFGGEVPIEGGGVHSVTLKSGRRAAQRDLIAACADCTDSRSFGVFSIYLLHSAACS